MAVSYTHLRPHDSEEIIRLFDRLREKIKDVVIRTSLIVGFPGETQSQFDEPVSYTHLDVYKRQLQTPVIF